MTSKEFAAVAEWRAASDALGEAYIEASHAGVDADKWTAYIEARERASMAGHVLFRYSQSLRIGQAA